MKKNWEEAKIETLEINATAGGPIYDTTADGESWWNEGQNRWETPSGHDKTSLN